ncbi:hypothetical protein HPB50_014739 [Hyalomma asiaticum]|uniref:Uncharacterized protein n=1 Tax=Hyalomma asiaticum TaxID=266040 RepID=A0ACB7SA61_HYAAI|nr:hypothetical protein HPB50_014739 [Hyalomma asiaticum]
MSGIYTKKCVDDVWDSSEGALPFKLQRIAEEELGETSAKRREALERLSRLLEGIWVPEELSYAEFHRACLLCLEQMALNPSTQTSGIVLLVDYAEFTADKILSLNIGLVRKALGYVQEGMPMRLKAVHIVRQSYAFDMVFALFKPFIKAKMAERYRFHGENFEKLHEHIHPSALPEEYAGHRPPLDFEAYWKEVEEQEELLAHGNSFGYATENKDDMLADPEIPTELTTL